MRYLRVVLPEPVSPMTMVERLSLLSSISSSSRCCAGKIGSLVRSCSNRRANSIRSRLAAAAAAASSGVLDEVEVLLGSAAVGAGALGVGLGLGLGLEEVVAVGVATSMRSSSAMMWMTLEISMSRC